MLETIRSTLSLRAVTRRPLTRRLSLCGTALAMLIFPSLLGAQTVDSAKLLRFDVSALVGYRTSISFSSQPSSGEVSSNLLLDPSLSYGIAFGARIDEDNLVEFRWARQKTHLHTGSTVSIPFSEAAMLDQFHLDFTHEYAIEGWPVGARPFVMGSVGASRISNASNGSFVRFSMGLGGPGGAGTVPGPRPGPGRPRTSTPAAQRVQGHGLVFRGLPASRSRGQSPAKSRGTRATRGSPRPVGRAAARASPAGQQLVEPGRAVVAGPAGAAGPISQRSAGAANPWSCSRTRRDGRGPFAPGLGVDVLPAGDEVGEDLGRRRPRSRAAAARSRAGGPRPGSAGRPSAGSASSSAGSSRTSPPRVGPAFEQLGRQRRADRVAGGQVVEADQGVRPEEAADDRRRAPRRRARSAVEGRRVERRLLRRRSSASARPCPAGRSSTARPCASSSVEEAEHRPGQLARGEVAQAPERLGHLVGRAGRVADAAEPALDPADRARVEPARMRRGVEQRVEQVRRRRPAAAGAGRPGAARPTGRGTASVNRKIRSEANGEAISPCAGDDPDRARPRSRRGTRGGGAGRGRRRGIRGRSRPRSGSRGTGGRPGAGPWPGAAGARAASASPGRAGASAGPGRRSGGTGGRTGRCRPARRGSRSSAVVGGQAVEQVERRLVGLGQAEQEPVVAVEAGDRDPQPLAGAGPGAPASAPGAACRRTA